jgi:hypothetical protein
LELIIAVRSTSRGILHKCNPMTQIIKQTCKRWYTYASRRRIGEPENNGWSVGWCIHNVGDHNIVLLVLILCECSKYTPYALPLTPFSPFPPLPFLPSLHSLLLFSLPYGLVKLSGAKVFQLKSHSLYLQMHHTWTLCLFLSYSVSPIPLSFSTLHKRVRQERERERERKSERVRRINLIFASTSYNSAIFCFLGEGFSDT